MNSFDALQSISKYLSRFSEQVTILNSNSEFSINIHAENLILKLLNCIFESELKNQNHSSSGIYKAIDLLALEQRLSVQVTSEKNTKKVKETIQKFFEANLHEKADVLYVYIITSKQESYDNDSIKKLLEQNNKEYGTNLSLHIWDKRDLYNKLYYESKIDKLLEVQTILKQEFDKIEEKESLTPYFKKLKNYIHEPILNDEKGLTLHEIYIEPSFSIFRNAVHTDKYTTSNLGSIFFNVDDRYKIHEFCDDLFAKRNPLDLKFTSNVLVILGYPGQGKSSFCKRLLNNYLFNKKNQSKAIYYFQLRHIRDVRDFIFNPIGLLYNDACEQTETTLNKFDFNKSMLVLDGLDELYMRDNLKTEDIDRLCIELLRCSEKYPEMQIVLTSRYGYIDLEKFQKEKIIICNLGMMTEYSQCQWIEIYKKFHPECKLSKSKIKEINSEPKNQYLKELIAQPLLLNMIASLNDEIEMSSNRAAIYSQLFTELIDRKYSKDGQLEVLNNIRKEDLRELIRAIAFSIFVTGEEYISKQDLLKIVDVQEYLKDLSSNSLKDSIKGIMMSFYFKEALNEQVTDNYAIEFLHKSLKEYMTAEYIYEKLHELLTEKTNRDRFVLDTPEKLSSVINEILGKVFLSNEIIGYLEEIIENDQLKDTNLLRDRMALALGYLFNKDFLVNYNSTINESPINKANVTFNNFWTYLSLLGPSRNYLINQEYRDSFSYLISCFQNLESSLHTLDFSWQDISGVQFMFQIIYGCKFDNTVINDVAFTQIRVHASSIQNCELNETFFDDVSFNNSKISNVIFKDCYFQGLSLFQCELINCQFINCQFHQLEIDRIADDESMTSFLSNINFVNCESDQMSKDSIEEFFINTENIILYQDSQQSTTSHEVMEINDIVNLNNSDYKKIIFI